MIECLIPHVRKFVQLRQVFAGSQALNASLNGLLDNDRAGVIQLDRDGRILEVNDRARNILRRDDGLYDKDGALRAWVPADDARLQKLLAGALAPPGRAATAGATTIRRSGDARRLMVAVNPVAGPALDFGARRVAALVLLTDPGGRPRLDADTVADVLGLTAAESRIAVMLSEGMSAPDIATTTGRRASTVNTLIQRAYRKLGISRQAGASWRPPAGAVAGGRVVLRTPAVSRRTLNPLPPGERAASVPSLPPRERGTPDLPRDLA